jgi:hypothetical protein
VSLTSSEFDRQFILPFFWNDARREITHCSFGVKSRLCVKIRWTPSLCEENADSSRSIIYCRPSYRLFLFRLTRIGAGFVRLIVRGHYNHFGYLQHGGDSLKDPVHRVASFCYCNRDTAGLYFQDRSNSSPWFF